MIGKMVEADVIVMATPVYFYTLCAQMKTLIDRTCARYTEMGGKEFYFILTAAEESVEMMERTVECFRGFLDCLDDPEERGDPLYRDLLELVFTHIRECFIVIDREFIYEIGVLYLSIAAQAMIASLKNRFQEE